MRQMKVSLIVATVGRTEELATLLNSLQLQSYRDFEVIVVDQNADDRLEPLLVQFRDRFRITHLRSARGLSRARNAGLACATGDVVAFPDDDCWYPTWLLESVVASFLARAELAGVSGRCQDREGRQTVTRWAARPGSVNKMSVWRKTTSVTVFLRRSCVNEGLRFDETLGAGAETPWGAGEDIDFVLQALEHGARIEYDPTLVVFHSDPVIDYGDAARQRASRYAAGMGRVLRKHRYPLWFAGYQVLRPALGAVLSLARMRGAKARFHWAMARGRLRGWRGR